MNVIYEPWLFTPFARTKKYVCVWPEKSQLWQNQNTNEQLFHILKGSRGVKLKKTPEVTDSTLSNCTKGNEYTLFSKHLTLSVLPHVAMVTSVLRASGERTGQASEVGG